MIIKTVSKPIVHAKHITKSSRLFQQTSELQMDDLFAKIKKCNEMVKMEKSKKCQIEWNVIVNWIPFESADTRNESYALWARSQLKVQKETKMKNGKKKDKL